jgi:hypothetical protein
MLPMAKKKEQMLQGVICSLFPPKAVFLPDQERKKHTARSQAEQQMQEAGREDFKSTG